MSIRKSKTPTGETEPGGKPTGPERKLLAEIERAFGKNTPEPALVTCDPQGNGRRLEQYLGEVVEPYLVEESHMERLFGNQFSFIVGLIDKSRQNPINKLGGKNGAGDESMKAYWQVGAMATRLLGGINGSDKLGLHLTRVSPTSDEGIIVIGGIRLTEDTELQFRKCWEFARSRLDLSSFGYSVVAGDREFRLNLEAFSKVLRHPEMAVACSYSVSRPIPVSIEAESDFIMDEIRKLENSEISFYHLLPAALRRNGGVAEVQTPFVGNLFAKGVRQKERGHFIEIKLDISGFAKELLRFTVDGEWGRGTRKGYAEIFSGRGGMRFLNTFLGKARANRILTPIAKAMGDVAATPVNVMPISGGYLQYWVDNNDKYATREIVELAIRKRFSEAREGDLGYLDLDFGPVIDIVPASSVSVEDTRARFILDSLSRVDDGPLLLERTDFMLNFIENISTDVQSGIFGNLERMGGTDRRFISRLESVCAARRTIRDVEDLIWTLREDRGLDGELRAERKDIEKWVFDFADARADRMFLLLNERIEREL